MGTWGGGERTAQTAVTPETHVSLPGVASPSNPYPWAPLGIKPHASMFSTAESPAQRLTHPFFFPEREEMDGVRQQNRGSSARKMGTSMQSPHSPRAEPNMGTAGGRAYGARYLLSK